MFTSDVLELYFVGVGIGFILAVMCLIVYFGVTNSNQTCTAYQAIDGKPVCIEYQLNK
jgi:hypothetical protein